MCYTLIGLPLVTYMSFYGMMQGDNANIKEQIGITLFIDLIVIYLTYHCIIVFCIYSKTALYNIPIGFKVFALMTCISKQYKNFYLTM